MNLLLQRKWYTDLTTIGELFIDGEFFCYTLEDQVREDGVKVKGETAIASGQYPIVLNHSPKYNRIMPRLLNVPLFDGILIHWGNKAADTAGCILVGSYRDRDWLFNSKPTFYRLFAKLEAAKNTGSSFSITIEDCANEA